MIDKIPFFLIIHNGLCVLSPAREPDQGDIYTFFCDSLPDERMGSRPGTMNLVQVIHL